MADYLILNGAVTLAVIIAAWLTRRNYRLRPVVFGLAVLLVLTAVFDNLIIAAGIVAYDEATILGVKLLKAPIEDFAYSIAAILLMLLLWKVTAKK